jgi:adenine-specific DNA-methyltransferase
MTMIGSKLQSLPVYRPMLPELGVRTVLDAFCGSAVVGADWKRLGYRVHSNDIAPFSEQCAITYVEADGDDHLLRSRIAGYLDILNGVTPIDGYVTAHWVAPKPFLSVENARKIDGILMVIPTLTACRSDQAIVRTALREAAGRVMPTGGTEGGAFRSAEANAKRDRPIVLTLPDLIPGTGTVTRMDARDCVRQFTGDLAFFEPPYNEHRYDQSFPISTYLAGGAPAPPSVWSDRQQAAGALADLVAATTAPYILLQYAPDGFVSPDQIMTTLRVHGHVGTVSIPVKGYQALRLKDRVKRAERRWRRETLYLVGPDPDRVDAAIAAGERVAALMRAGAHVYDLRDAVKQGVTHHAIAATALSALARDQGWRHYRLPDTDDAVHRDDFGAFLAEVGTDLAALRRLCGDHAEALDAIDRVAQGKKHVRADGNNVTIKPEGNSRQQALRALRTHRPDLHAKVLAGELTPHRAMVEAGLRRPTMTVPADDVNAGILALERRYGAERVWEAMIARREDDGI